MDIKKLAKQIHAQNIKKGFWNKERNEGEVLFLIITELAEMVEADREGRIGYIKQFEEHIKRADKFKYSKKHKLEIKRGFFENYVKDSIGDELADAFIRMCDYCVGFKINISEFGINEQLPLFKNDKLQNLGEELLVLSGIIRTLHRGILKSVFADVIFAHIIWLSQQLDIPLEKHVKLKMWYNSTRPKMHNKKY